LGSSGDCSELYEGMILHENVNEVSRVLITLVRIIQFRIECLLEDFG